jgi:hypothetical protein
VPSNCEVLLLRSYSDVNTARHSMFQRSSTFSPWRVTVTLFWLRRRCIHCAAGWMIRFPFGASIFCGLRNVQPRSVAHSAPFSLGTGACLWYIGHSMKLTTHILLVPTLTFSGSLPPPTVCLSGVLRDTSAFAHSQHLVNETLIVSIIPIQLQHLFQISF